jgi:putative transposase
MDAFQASQKALNKKNKRNGQTSKRLITESGPVEISTPRDRNGDFEPELVGKRERVLSSIKS